MDSPICAKRNSFGLRIEIFRRFGRILAPDGEIVMEFAAAHVLRNIDRARWPVLLPLGLPADAIAIDRYGDYRAGRCTPHGITNPDLAAAILAMEPASVAHMQNDDNGCGSAVIAHLVGAPYADVVRSLFPRSAKARRIGTRRLADASGTIRRECASRTWAELREAEAVAALIKNRRGNQHYVAIDPGMVVVDPELVLRYPLAEYPRKAWTPMVYFVRG